MRLEISINKRRKLSDKLNQQVCNTFLNLSSESLTGEIKKKTPVKYGKLRGSWTPKVSRDKLTVKNSREYAVYVEKGTGMFSEQPHMITPRNANVFHAEIGGNDVFFTHHKGMEGRHMAEEGTKAFKKQIPQIWRNAFIKHAMN